MGSLIGRWCLRMGTASYPWRPLVTQSTLALHLPEAADEATAIEKAAAKFKVLATKLMATRR
jgi:hypothetical protein